MMQLLSMRVRSGPGNRPAPVVPWFPRAGRAANRRSGFTLIELMIVVAIIAILAAIAYPAYLRYAVKAHRVAAESCLSDLSNYMQRYYTTNLRYVDASGNKIALPQLDCRKQTSENYSYSFQGTPTAASFTLQAVPQGSQASQDTQCGTLTMDQAGTRTVSGSGTTDECWNR